VSPYDPSPYDPLIHRPTGTPEQVLVQYRMAAALILLALGFTPCPHPGLRTVRLDLSVIGPYAHLPRRSPQLASVLMFDMMPDKLVDLLMVNGLPTVTLLLGWQGYKDLKADSDKKYEALDKKFDTLKADSDKKYDALTADIQSLKDVSADIRERLAYSEGRFDAAGSRQRSVGAAAAAVRSSEQP